MKFLVIYDISSNALRQKIITICKNFGLKRIQKSAFSGELSLNNAQMLALECRNLEPSDTDAIFVLPCCDACFDKKEIIGQLDEDSLEKPDLMVV